MKTIVKSIDPKDFTSTREFPEGFSVNGIVSNYLETTFANVKDQTHEIILNGICIEQRKVFATSGYKINVLHDFPFLKMHFEMNGYSHYNNKVKGSLDVEIPGGHHMLMFLPEVKGDLHYTGNRNTLEIKLSIDFLNRIFEGDLSLLRHFGKGIEESNPTLLYNKSRPITPRMVNTISEIIRCPYTGIMGRAFLEAKVTELLILQLEQFLEPVEERKYAVISHDDISRFHYVREIIQSNCAQPLSLKQLSIMSGLNLFKLKRGFKELFNTTVFDYVAATRMETAFQHLANSNSPIADIAMQVGYKNPQHFTAAFKRKFGFLPKELRVKKNK